MAAFTFLKPIFSAEVDIIISYHTGVLKIPQYNIVRLRCIQLDSIQ